MHLLFWVNDQIVAQTTDTDHPLRTGSVGIGVTEGKWQTKGIWAEFDNFTVTQVQRARS